MHFEKHRQDVTIIGKQQSVTQLFDLIRQKKTYETKALSVSVDR